MSKRDRNSGCGCLSVVFAIVAIWALLFGVTIGGKHYGITGCDMDNGVKIDR